MLKHNLIKIARRGDSFKLFFLLSLCFVLLFAQKKMNYSFVIRDHLSAWLEPIRSIPNTFFNWYVTLEKTMQSNHQDWQSQLNYLEKKNLLLATQVHHLSLIKQQNYELLKLLEAKSSIPDFVSKLAEIRFTANGRSPYEISINLDASDGLKVGQAVVNDQGVVGQISYVGLTSARVRLLNAPSMSIPVYNKRNGLKAIAHGSSLGMILNSPDTRLNILPKDIFLATGLGGVFPPGYPVGKITKVQTDRYMIRSQMQTIVPTQALRRVLVLIPKK